MAANPGTVLRVRPPARVVSRCCFRILCGFLLWLSGTLFAQPASRAEAIAAEEAEKAKTLEPPKLSKAEEWVLKGEQLFLVDPSGFFPYFDSVYQGGGLTLGAGYRKFFGDNSFWDVKGLYSIKNYKLIQGDIISRDHLNRRLDYGLTAGWRDATQVSYFGIGPQTHKDDRTNFRFQESYFEGFGEFGILRWLPIRGGVGFEQWNTLEGQGDEPSIETRHTSATAPGLGADIGYVHSRIATGIDSRISPGYTRRGGLYQATLHDYRETSGGGYSFQRLDLEAIQHVPLLRETWVLAARGRMQTTLNNNDIVPYFMLPSLGSGSTLRGFDTYRFRDLHSILFNAEFRWIPTVGLDMALFYDAGKVASRRGDLDFTHLKSDFGIGARFHGPAATPLRIDLAISNEGWRIVFAGGPIF